VLKTTDCIKQPIWATEPNSATPHPHRVDIVVYPGFKSLEAIGLVSVFAYANRELERCGSSKRYDVEVVSLAEGSVPSDTGVEFKALRSLRWDSPPDTALIVGTHGIEKALAMNGEITEWCKWATPRVSRMAGLCSGSFFLAETGLLDDRKATTHWSVIGLMRERYPKVQVEDDALFVRTGNLWTSAGVSTAVDLALAFVEDDCGRTVALDAARELVIFVKRPGGQSQVSASLASQMTGSAGIRDVQNWILANLECKLTVEEMAKRSCMSVRHFSRVFREETGLSPSRFVERARLEGALRLLEDTLLPLKTIAFRCGFASDEQMRKVFKKRLARTAREYRLQRLGRDLTLVPVRSGFQHRDHV
jgi:transcriptional regulator GlxA family with amidase domain